MRRIRYLIFLKDVFWLACTAFGGPQAHLMQFLEHLVQRRRYLTEEELLELTALCNFLPGPTSTQTITTIGFRIGGPGLAYLTLLLWITPAVLIMTGAAVCLVRLQEQNISLDFVRYIQPIAVGFVIFGGFKLGEKTVHTKTSVLLLLSAALISYLLRYPWVGPVLLVLGGAITTFRFRQHEKVWEKEPLRIEWANFFLWASVLAAAAILGALTRWLPVRLFENFYRNGSLLFGGGHVLFSLMFTEFVLLQKKQYLSAEEFRSGMALAQVVPGPVFSFTAFIGVMAMREYGFGGQLLGSFVATVGIFLPGTFFIFFVYRFWNGLKQYRVVRASLEGIQAISIGLIVSAAVLLFLPLRSDPVNIAGVVITCAVLQFTRIPPILLITAGLAAGIFF